MSIKAKFPFIERDAVISDCGKYRYLLRRVWNNNARALVVMLNPSTADAYTDDPTIWSCYRLLSELGFGSFEVVNLFGYRTSYPKELSNTDIADIIGPKNDDIIRAAVNRYDVIVCAWGSNHEAFYRAINVKNMLRLKSPVLYCFGTNKQGSPKHPLYVKSSTNLKVYY